MLGRRKILWLIPVALAIGIGASGAIRAFAGQSPAQQAFCQGDGMNPEEQPVLEGLSQYEALAGEEIVLSLYGGGFSQVEGVQSVLFRDLELPVLDCAVISPGEMQVRIFFPPETPAVEDLLVIVLIANGDEAFVRSVFQVFPLEELPPEEFPPEEFPPEEFPPEEFPPEDGPEWFIDPEILIFILILLGFILLVLALPGIWLVRRLLRPGDKAGKKPPPDGETQDTQDPDPAPQPPDVQFVHETDPAAPEINPDGPQPPDLEIRIELDRDPGWAEIEIQDPENP